MTARRRSTQDFVPNRVLAYPRVSTDEQADEGFSLPVQREKLVKWVEVQWGSQVPIIWYDDEGFSAKNLNRPGLTRLRQEARPDDLVLVLKLDRLTRSVRDLYELLAEWDDHGILFRSATEPYDTTKPEGKFMIGLLGLLAEWERERIGERVRDVMGGIMTSDTPRPLTRPPYGYRMVNEQYLIHPEEAAVVRAIYDEYLKGRGTRAIAIWLNASYPKPGGSQWGDYQVSYILSNPVYMGRLAWNRVMSGGKRKNSARTGNAATPDLILVDGEHVPIVTPEVWEAAQATKDRRKSMAPRQATGGHVLTGIAVCGLCGGPISGVTQKRYKDGVELPSKAKHYYRCSRRDHYKSCDLPWQQIPLIEQRVLEQLTYLAEPSTMRQLAEQLMDQHDVHEHRRRIGELEVRLRGLERKRGMWDDLLAAERDEAGSGITQAEWRERTAEIRQEQASIREDLEQLRRNTPIPVDVASLAEQMRNLVEIWEELLPRERKTVLQALVEQVVIHPDGTVKVLPKVYGQQEVATIG